MKTFSCNAIFFPFPDQHNAAKKQQKKTKTKKPQDKEKNRTFPKTEFLKI